jgi:hypothetical protein
MSVTVQANRYSYTGNGVTTVFPFPSRFNADGELKVISKNKTTFVETVKTLTTHYTVAGEGDDAGGAVTFLVAPTSNEDIIIYCDPDVDHDFELEDNGKSPAASHELAYDKAVLLIRRLKDSISRTLRLSEGFTDTFDLTLPKDISDPANAGFVIALNDDNDGIQLIDPADFTGIQGPTGPAGATADYTADAELNALAGLTSAANKVPYFTGSGTAALADLSAAGRALIDDADAAAQRTTLGSTTVGDAVFIAANAAAARTALGLVIGTNVQAQDDELTAIAVLTSAADKVPYFTGLGTAALATLTSAARTLIAAVDAAAQRTALGLGIGVDVQAYDAQLSSLVRQNSQSAAYTCVLTDGGKHILHPSADTTARIFTIPANSSVAYPTGTAITFVNQNGGGVITIAITTDTMRLAGAGTTGSRTLAANGIATALKITSTEWIISGTGLT